MRRQTKKRKKKIAIKYTRKSESVYELISENASTVNETLIAKVISLRTGNAFTSNILKGRKIVIRYTQFRHFFVGFLLFEPTDAICLDKEIYLTAVI